MSNSCIIKCCLGGGSSQGSKLLQLSVSWPIATQLAIYLLLEVFYSTESNCFLAWHIANYVQIPLGFTCIAIFIFIRCNLYKCSQYTKSIHTNLGYIYTPVAMQLQFQAQLASLQTFAYLHQLVNFSFCNYTTDCLIMHSHVLY